MSLKKKLVRLAYQKPALRPHLLPILKEAGWFSKKKPEPGDPWANQSETPYIAIVWRGPIAEYLRRSPSNAMDNLSKVEFYKKISGAESAKLLRASSPDDPYADPAFVAVLYPKSRMVPGTGPTPTLLDEWEGRSFGYRERRGLEADYEEGLLHVKINPSVEMGFIDSMGFHVI